MFAFRLLEPRKGRVHLIGTSAAKERLLTQDPFHSRGHPQPLVETDAKVKSLKNKDDDYPKEKLIENGRFIALYNEKCE